jgi:hypothetical protein
MIIGEELVRRMICMPLLGWMDGLPPLPSPPPPLQSNPAPEFLPSRYPKEASHYRRTEVTAPQTPALTPHHASSLHLSVSLLGKLCQPSLFLERRKWEQSPTGPVSTPSRSLSYWSEARAPGQHQTTASCRNSTAARQNSITC